MNRNKRQTYEKAAFFKLKHQLDGMSFFIKENDALKCF